PSPGDLFTTGTVVKVLKSVKMPGNKLNVIIQGLARIRVRGWKHTSPFLRIDADVFEETSEHDSSLDELLGELRELSQKIFDLSPQIPSEAGFLVRSIDNPGILADIVASNLSMSVEEKQRLLETFDTRERIQAVIELLNKEIQVLELSNKIQTEVKGEMDKAQREYFLREQLKAIQKELGDTDERQEEFDDLEKAIRDADMPQEVEKVAVKELKRMARMNPGAAEYTVSRTYLDWLIELPWSTSTEDHHDLKRAEQILDEDHYDLVEIKKRIVEYLAVHKLKADMKGPILCLVGPPGVGKTSLATSVARALDRKMVRVSLGGVHDEAEIRGHRRTYIGSLPGKIIKGMKKAGSNNPVFVLDEIDKLGRDHRGDPASALLEVLDPEQNHSFTDHYLDVPFDLSKVLFIATGNWPEGIPGPLYDRMEVLYVSGYTLQDKLNIAFHYLIPEVLKDHGLTGEHVEFTEESVKFLVEAYTREPGVRALKREIAACARAIAKLVASGEQEGKAVISPDRIQEIRGPIKHFHEIAQRVAVPGVATGLSWTAAGGDILFIEATKFKGKGQLHLSGKLGDVMKESVSVARSYVRAMSGLLGIADDVFEENDIHVHVPAGAIGKDGPSAGIAIVTAITSLLTGIPVDPTLGMTGEVTLRGAVMPIGGVKEKIVAAHRAGITKVILPEWNKKDVFHEVPEEVREEMSFHFCSRMEEVLELALGMEGLAERVRVAELNPPSPPPEVVEEPTADVD
ncbi:MAG: endopeptidase La, partial [Pseudomonadota bacterium]